MFPDASSIGCFFSERFDGYERALWDVTAAREAKIPPLCQGQVVLGLITTLTTQHEIVNVIGAASADRNDVVDGCEPLRFRPSLFGDERMSAVEANATVILRQDLSELRLARCRDRTDTFFLLYL